jgi:hypothetical protein
VSPLRLIQGELADLEDIVLGRHAHPSGAQALCIARYKGDEETGEVVQVAIAFRWPDDTIIDVELDVAGSALGGIERCTALAVMWAIGAGRPPWFFPWAPPTRTEES